MRWSTTDEAAPSRADEPAARVDTPGPAPAPATHRPSGRDPARSRSRRCRGPSATSRTGPSWCWACPASRPGRAPPCTSARAGALDAGRLPARTAVSRRATRGAPPCSSTSRIGSTSAPGRTRRSTASARECSIVVFGSSRLEVVTVFGQPAPPPVTVVADPTAVPPGGTLTATAASLPSGVDGGLRRLPARTETRTADCGRPPTPCVVDDEGRAAAAGDGRARVAAHAGRHLRGGRGRRRRRAPCVRAARGSSAAAGPPTTTLALALGLAVAGAAARRPRSSCCGAPTGPRSAGIPSPASRCPRTRSATTPTA